MQRQQGQQRSEPLRLCFTVYFEMNSLTIGLVQNQRQVRNNMFKSKPEGFSITHYVVSFHQGRLLRPGLCPQWLLSSDGDMGLTGWGREGVDIVHVPVLARSENREYCRSREISRQRASSLSS